MTTVLVVDKSVTNRRLLHDLLSLKGHEVIEADDGAQAVDMVRRAAPTIVVTDLAPDDDRGAVRLLRADPDTADIPMVAYSDPGDEQGLRSMADAYHVDLVLAEPADPGPLLAAVESLIAGHTAGAAWLPTDPRSLRLALDDAPVGVVAGTAGQASYANPNLAQLTGVPVAALRGEGWLHQLSEHGRREVRRMLAVDPDPAAPAWHHRDRVARSGQRPQWLDLTLRQFPAEGNRPAGFVAFIMDVTTTVDSGRPEPTERAALRLSTLSRVTGGVAHGYNNSLAVILSYAEFLRERVGEAQARGRLDRTTAHDLLLDVGTILTAGHRATQLTQLLQSFGHRGRPLTPTVTDLNACLKPEIAALRDRLAERPDPPISLRVELAAGLRLVVADARQVGQLLRYLTDNSCEAMPQGGTLHIATTTGLADVDAAVPLVDDSGPPPLSAYDHVRLTVRDTGPGMTAAIARHAVEPFFTTKLNAEGAGLGLTAVDEIVGQLGGELLIDTAPGAGTAVHVLFPVAAATAGEPPPEAPEASPGMAETIVVVDDELPVRSLVHRILSRVGYQVLTASSATEALDVIRAHPGPVDCLITDLAMPGMPGTELTRRLRAERPGLAVLYMSGYAEQALHHVGTADDRTNLLPKPFSRGGLLTAVRATIQEHRATRAR